LLIEPILTPILPQSEIILSELLISLNQKKPAEFAIKKLALTIKTIAGVKGKIIIVVIAKKTKFLAKIVLAILKKLIKNQKLVAIIK
jgi:hypothetical protein